MDEPTKQIVDTFSVATMVGTLAGLLPAIAALLTIIWTAIRIWETDTVQDLFQKRRKRDKKGRFMKEDD
mgnify:FL=1|jgi:hypothetical protein|tara:strand:+ start:295 stop:501 length:207 start_codon:yes stop_codon:yes gene_type:complete